jgi:hypothetical protein
MSSPLHDNQKLTVTFRLEPGCLGPEGESHIEKFCVYAQNEFTALTADVMNWRILPRRDKSLSEMQYQINAKSLSTDQATQYLKVFDINRDEFEAGLQEKLALLIDSYLGHSS